MIVDSTQNAGRFALEENKSPFKKRTFYFVESCLEVFLDTPDDNTYIILTGADGTQTFDIVTAIEETLDNMKIFS